MDVSWWIKRRAGALVLMALFAVASAGAVRADAYTFHASSSGQRTLDQGEGGGNPFASALIEVLQRPSVVLSELPDSMKALTTAKSRGRQEADVPRRVDPAGWSLVPPAASEKRMALVLVVSDYTRAGVNSLPGARADAARIAEALKAAGFETEVALDLDRAAIKSKLDAFGRATRSADVAVIYTTGHGIEVGGRVYLIPADYPAAERNAALSSRAVRLTDIAAAPRAKRVNLLFYGGCRDNPFGGG